MSAKQRWQPLARHTLSAPEAIAVTALRDRCNAVDGLDLKVGISTFAAEALDTTSRPSAFLLYVDDVLGGYCLLDGDQHSVEICGMVAPAHRRQGIGQALLNAALAACHADALADILLICEEVSASGRAFAAANDGSQEFAEHRLELRDFAAMQRGLTREPGLILRRAGREDAGTLAHTRALIFDEESEAEALQASILEEFPHPSTSFYLAELEGKPVSSLKLYREEDRAFIYAFGVLPEYRRHGIARQTLALLVKDLQAEGITRIGLEVETTNNPAIALYLSCGFSLITTYGYYRMRLRGGLPGHSLHIGRIG
jgi:ribosomal protein S18 acetylase RimI-like enzyme